ncbi:HEPN domain-containing protein [Candidatus Woesebacteria bacterium]|nr:HEPN domain-containing protein [Candidatus Woesebacteria bacterium]
MKDTKPNRYNLLGLHFYTPACFLAQQAAEKALKAYLLAHGVALETIKIHTLIRLIKECLRFSPEFSELKSKCQLLDRYYISTRYPPDAGPLSEFTDNEAEEAITYAQEVIEFIDENVSQQRD